MARRTFFSFHYDNDVWRAQQVKNAWVTQDREAAGFFDGSAFEKKKRESPDALRRFLNDEMSGSSVLCVLIGSDTWERHWVRYEIIRAIHQGKGVFGARIHGLKNRDGLTATSGRNVLEYLGYSLNKETNVVTFKEYHNGAWRTFPDIQTVGYLNIPFVFTTDSGNFASLFSTYDYVTGDGYKNMGSWIEKAAKQANR